MSQKESSQIFWKILFPYHVCSNIACQSRYVRQKDTILLGTKTKSNTDLSSKWYDPFRNTSCPSVKMSKQFTATCKYPAFTSSFIRGGSTNNILFYSWWTISSFISLHQPMSIHLINTRHKYLYRILLVLEKMHK